MFSLLEAELIKRMKQQNDHILKHLATICSRVTRRVIRTPGQQLQVLLFGSETTATPTPLPVMHSSVPPVLYCFACSPLFSFQV